MNAESNRLCGDCGKAYTGHHSMVCPHDPKPTPPAPATPNCVRCGRIRMGDKDCSCGPNGEPIPAHIAAELTTLRQRLAEAEADIARWEGAARVLADELHVRRRGDPMGVLPDVRNQTDANPTASALVREGGGGTC